MLFLFNAGGNVKTEDGVLGSGQSGGLPMTHEQCCARASRYCKYTWEALTLKWAMSPLWITIQLDPSVYRLGLRRMVPVLL